MLARMSETWTTRRLLQWTTQHFEQKTLEAPRMQAEMLLAHVLGCDRIRLYMEPDRPANEPERQQLRDLVKRAGNQEPVDYLVGQAPFFALDFKVGPAVLIPRPSTETLISFVLQDVKSRGLREHALRVADVGTGSGAIVIALLKHLPKATAVATDLSPEALEVARDNAQRHRVSDRIEFRQGDLLAPLGEERFDFLLSNPPYISDAEWEDVEPNVKDYEPTSALRGGVDGLDLLRPLIARASGQVVPGGWCCLEIADSQADAVRALASQAGWSAIDVLNDHEQLPRIVVGRPIPTA